MFTRFYLLSTLCLGFSVLAQEVDYGATLGYQNVDVSGNEGVYRSQEDEASGLLLDALWFNVSEPEDKSRLYDHLRIDASGFGASPHGRFMLKMSEAESYQLRLNYQHFSQFSLLPSYANPLESQGIYPGQHQWDRSRENLDAHLVFRPQSRLQPILGYRVHDNQGPGQTTFTVGGDEFLLESDLDESESELYAGFGFRVQRWNGEFIVGQREFKSHNYYGLVPGAGAGNSSGAILGHDISLDQLDRNDRVDVDTTVIRAHVVGRLNDTTRLLTSFVHSDSETEASSSETLAGDLVSFRLRSLFGGRNEVVGSQVAHPSWRGDVRFESHPAERIELDARLVRNHREMDGRALISATFLDATTLGGNALDNFTELIETNSLWERDDTHIETSVTTKLPKYVGTRLGWSSLRSASLITADLGEIVIPGGQDGTYQRRTNTYKVAVFVDVSIVKVELEWSDASADRAVFRSDYLDRESLRLRLDLTPWKFLQIHALARDADYGNDTELINYDGSDLDYNLAVDIQPLKDLNLHLGYGGYELDTDILMRRPENFQYVHSLHQENGTAYEGNLEYHFLKKHTLALDYSSYENEGSLPFENERWQLRLEWGFTKTIGAILQAGHREYSETNLSIADYDADNAAILLRITN